jgi:hypothetical protein
VFRPKREEESGQYSILNNEEIHYYRSSVVTVNK